MRLKSIETALRNSAQASTACRHRFRPFCSLSVPSLRRRDCSLKHTQVTSYTRKGRTSIATEPTRRFERGDRTLPSPPSKQKRRRAASPEEKEESAQMARGAQTHHHPNSASFFAATLLLWAVSVAFEIAVNKRLELLAVAAGFCFYQAANWIIRRFISRDPLFVNTSVSLLHSTTTSGSVILILLNHWLNKGLRNMFDHVQLFSGTWMGAYMALCFSCGYFAYDQLDMLQYRLYSGRIPAILVHHLILLVCFTLALYRNVTINYLILSLVCELHSVFLHVRKVRRMAGVRDANSGVVRAEWVLNWLTFFTARVGFHALITYKLIVDAKKFGKGIELPLALAGMAGMNVLNIFLGRDLFQAYKREKNPQKNRG